MRWPPSCSLPLVLAAFGAGCSTSTLDPQAPAAAPTVASGPDPHAPLTAFVPPTPAGCAGAADYDGCFAFDGATPLAVHVTLPATTKKGAVMVVRFHLVPDPSAASGGTGIAADTHPLVADHVEFRLAERHHLQLYFQVFPGSYQIEVGVDTDGDGNPDGPSDAKGWSSISSDEAVVNQADAALVDVGTTPVLTTMALALPQ